MAPPLRCPHTFSSVHCQLLLPRSCSLSWLFTTRSVSGPQGHVRHQRYRSGKRDMSVDPDTVYIVHSKVRCGLQHSCWG